MSKRTKARPDAVTLYTSLLTECLYSRKDARRMRREQARKHSTERKSQS